MAKSIVDASLKPLPVVGEQEKLARLRRMKRLPLLLLALMVILFPVYASPACKLGWVVKCLR